MVCQDFAGDCNVKVQWRGVRESVESSPTLESTKKFLTHFLVTLPSKEILKQHTYRHTYKQNTYRSEMAGAGRSLRSSTRVGSAADIEAFKTRLAHLVYKYPGKRVSELPVKWQEEFGGEINYTGIGFDGLLPCLHAFDDVVDLYLEDGKDIQYKVRLRPNAK